MRQSMKKRLAVVLLTAVIAAGAMAGCGQETIKDSDVVATVGKTEIKGNIANFFARYQQAMYETYYSSMLGENMWTTKVDDDTTYEESAKETIMQSLEELYLLNEHVGDYDVSLTEDEKKAIGEAADAFVEANGENVREVISGDKETVEEVLRLFTIQQKMRTEMLKDVDRKVSDEEAAQKAMQYVAFTYSEESKSEDSESTSDTKEEAKTKADTFLDAVKGGTDFEQAAKDQETSTLDLTFNSETTSPNEEVIAAADKLDAGQVTDVIETDSGYYVAKVTSTFDQTATDNKKQQIISERENDRYNEIVEGWKDDTKIKENKDVWKKIDFNEQGVAVKKAEDDSDSTDNSTSKDSTDEENTDDSENTDNTDNAEEAAE
mgnify:CR=1 FL=1